MTIAQTMHAGDQVEFMYNGRMRMGTVEPRTKTGLVTLRHFDVRVDGEYKSYKVEKMSKVRFLGMLHGVAYPR